MLSNVNLLPVCTSLFILKSSLFAYWDDSKGPAFVQSLSIVFRMLACFVLHT
jgi:hypothetical protein